MRGINQELSIKFKEELVNKLGRDVTEEEYKGISYALLKDTEIKEVKDVNWEEDFKVFETRADFLEYVFQEERLKDIFNTVSSYGSFDTFEKEVMKRYNAVFSKDRKVVQLGSIAPK